MILIQLFLMFFKIGLFSFGGGYAMVPLMQKELESNQWVQAREFADIVALSQMTPGPIAVNAATYIGMKVSGLPGSLFATIGVSLPSFILIVLIARSFRKMQKNRIMQSILSGIRPASIGLIGSAVIFFAGLSIITITPIGGNLAGILSGQHSFFDLFKISPAALLIFAIILVSVKRFKLHPILAIISSAVMGIIFL